MKSNKEMEAQIVVLQIERDKLRGLVEHMVSAIESLQHTDQCVTVNNEMLDALEGVPDEDRLVGDDAYRCCCGIGTAIAVLTEAREALK